MGYVPDLHKIWVGTSDQQLMALSNEFPGFYRYALIMEEASEAERNKASLPYDGMAGFSEEHKQRAAQLLVTAANLERGYARQASILLGNNAFRSGNDRSPTLKVFFALSRGRRGTQRALNSVSCLLLRWRQRSLSESSLAGKASFVQNSFEGYVIPLILDKAVLPCFAVIVAHAGGYPPGEG